MTFPRVSVILVTYNSRALLEECLSPLKDLVRDGLVELIVVDNMSVDDPEGELNDLGIPHRFIQRGSNDGFSVAVNAGARSADGEYILLLNPDVSHTSEVLLELLRRMDEDNSIGAMAPLLLSPNGVHTANGGALPRLLPMIAHLSGAAWLLRRVAPHLGHYVYADVSHGRTLEVGWLSGGYLLSRARFITDKLVSERWFMYAEDIDLCYYIVLQGSRLVLCGEVTAGHAIGGSSDSAISEIKTLWVRSLYDFYVTAFKPSNLTAFAWRLSVGAGYRLRAVLARVQGDRSRSSALLSYANALTLTDGDERLAVREHNPPRSATLPVPAE